MVDLPKLEQLLARLRHYVRGLEALAATPRDVFLANVDKIGSAKYHFVVAIECAIDIANHIVASEGLRIPKDNADTFAVLTEEGILARDRLTVFQAMARFRNRLVHLYWDVGDEAVYAFLQEGPGDLDSFVASVAAWLARSEREPSGRE